MSQFTQIESDQVIEVTPGIYDKQWISRMRIDSPTKSKSKVRIDLVPYDGVNVLTEPVTRFTIDNLFEAMQDENRPVELRTLLIQAMELILQSVKAEINWQKSLEDEQ